MRKLLPLSGALVLALAAGSVWPAVAGETVTEKTTTEKTTSYSGTVTQVDPSSSTIILRSESAAAPTRYTYSKKTTFIDESGNTITYEAIQNRPVTVYYTKDGDQMVVSRVVVNRPTAGVIQRKDTTIEREETD
jgi:hypothetical protein